MAIEMDDSRISQMGALIDDARVIAAELCDEMPTTRVERYRLAVVRQHLNNAIRGLNVIKSGDIA